MGIPYLPNTYLFLEQEKQCQQSWEEAALYKWDAKAERSHNFVIDTPPPTVSGNLHIGHVFSYTQADFIARFQRMLGKNVFYPIGFDDNGLPTERLVEKQKGVRAMHMAREDFIALCQEVVQTEEAKFREIFKAMGLSFDWSLEYQTISARARKLSQMSFLALLAKGEIYRSQQPILWDPVDETALAQADIEDKERTSFMYDILFHDATTNKPLTIATTRPELLPACVALFYHPDDLRYQDLAGGYAITPMFHQQVPILTDDKVEPTKGTGLVMCCTFGDQTDILWWKKHQLPTKIMLNKKGVFIGSESGPLEGLKVVEARKKVIDILKQEDLLQQQKEIVQSVKCAERSGAPLEILTLPQWFVRTLVHKPALLSKVEALKWHPAGMKQRLESWIHGIAWDWCISRQRYFGVPFPVWYSKRVGEEGKILLPTIEQLPVNPLQDLPIGYSREEVEPDYDVMDTWATSSISPQLSTHAIDEAFAIDYNRHVRLFPMDLRPQAHEIIRTWTFYTLLKAHLHEDSLPWTNIMISGWCLAPDKSKMSKSKGNIILPETLLKQYGADVLRYWSANARLGADTWYCENVMKNGKRLVTKLWNGGKFILQHLHKLDPSLLTASLATNQQKITSPLDRWLLHKLAELIEQSTAYWHAYGYTDGLELVEKFFWTTFCDNYLEISKARAYDADTMNPTGQCSAILTLYHTFYIILQLFAPILPYITETLAQGMYPHKGSMHTQGNWPFLSIEDPLDNKALQQGDNFVEILSLVRKAKADRNLSIKAPIDLLTIQGEHFLGEMAQDLQAVTMATTIAYNEPATEANTVQIKGKHCSISVLF